MASAFKISTSARNSALQAIMSTLRSGVSSAYALLIAEGAVPATFGDMTGLVELALIEHTANYFSSAGSITIPFPDGVVGASGSAGCFLLMRDVLSSPEVVAQGTCGDANDAPVNLQFNDKQLVEQGTLSGVSIALSFPEGG